MRAIAPAVALSIFAVVAEPVHAESKPGYCAELLPYAGYTITGEVSVGPEGFLYIATHSGTFVLGQRVAESATYFEALRLVQFWATETYLGRKDDQVYLIAQIDMDTPEPFCALQPVQ